jgi:hypothetical protein
MMLLSMIELLAREVLFGGLCVLLLMLFLEEKK